MSKKTPLIIFTLAMVLNIANATAYAHESTTGTPLGGLVFVKNDAISLDAENLFISRHKIRVDYQFTNTADEDLPVSIAFPLPPILPFDAEGALEDQINYYGNPSELNFHISLNGSPIGFTQVDQAFYHGEDITDRLTQNSVPLNRLLQNFDKKIDALPQAILDKLVADHLVQKIDNEWRGNWEMQTTMVRQITFPANKTVVIKHDYQPLVSQFDGHPVNNEPKLCIDEAWLKTASEKDRQQWAVTGQNPGTSTGRSYIVAYTARIGEMDKVPIDSFHLTIDKGDSGSMMSVCAAGIKKTSPTQFEARYSHFTPRENIVVLFTE